jgi:hypothetical protein
VPCSDPTAQPCRGQVFWDAEHLVTVRASRVLGGDGLGMAGFGAGFGKGGNHQAHKRAGG